MTWKYVTEVVSADLRPLRAWEGDRGTQPDRLASILFLNCTCPWLVSIIAISRTSVSSAASSNLSSLCELVQPWKCWQTDFACGPNTRPYDNTVSCSRIIRGIQKSPSSHIVSSIRPYQTSFTSPWVECEYVNGQYHEVIHFWERFTHRSFTNTLSTVWWHFSISGHFCFNGHSSSCIWR